MSAIPYPSQTNYLRVPDTATKKKDQLKGFSVEEVAKVSLSSTLQATGSGGSYQRGVHEFI